MIQYPVCRLRFRLQSPYQWSNCKINSIVYYFMYVCASVELCRSASITFRFARNFNVRPQTGRRTLALFNPLNAELNPICYLLALLGVHHFLHVSRIRVNVLNPLNPELNPICYLLALLGAHHFLHVSRIRVKSLTFRRLMSYIYGAPILDVSRSHTTTQYSR